ncbi:MAG TPA: metalloregulator ArsR/SmtB family transcription factor [Anaerolineales bacterium]|jgi:ArsR family transcriptional regulator
MEPNVTIPLLAEKIAEIFQVISSPARLAILLAIGRGEACVCHLESILGWRQAYISQHLMALRKADILQDRRDGRYVYYRLRDHAILSLVQDAAALSGFDQKSVNEFSNSSKGPGCECPHCNSAALPKNQNADLYQ